MPCDVIHAASPATVVGSGMFEEPIAASPPGNTRPVLMGSGEIDESRISVWPLPSVPVCIELPNVSPGPVPLGVEGLSGSAGTATTTGACCG